MRKIFFLLAVCAVFLAVVPSAFAGTPEIVERLTVQEVAEILKGEGYCPEIDGETACNFKIQGYSAQMILFNEGEALQFHASWINTKATLNSVNAWNKDWRTAKAYLDDDGNPHVEIDLDLAGGVTKDRIKNFMVVCRDLLVKFANEAI